LSKEVHAEFSALRKGLEQRRITIDTEIKGHEERLKAHLAARPERFPEQPERQSLEDAVEASNALHAETDAARQETSNGLHVHEQAVTAQAQHRENLAAAQAQARVWQQLHSLIGKGDGKAFKIFAQALNLNKLLGKANVHLKRLAERYELVPRLEDGLPTLEFDLSDLWQIGQRVAPQSLSGGERFLVSLALALGLSDFRSVKMPIETLLLDEGFGTLDPQTLSVALAALSQLQSDGRQVGIISHVVGLRDRVEARIEIRPLGGGRSEVVDH
jgi:exonuclease SbcC